MAKRRNRYNKAELYNIVLGLIYLACSVNCLLGALVMHIRTKPALGLLIWGGLALVMACGWFFSDPFKTGRPLSTLNDVIMAAVVVLALHGWFITEYWPMLFVVAVEAILIFWFYRSNRPKRR